MPAKRKRGAPDSESKLQDDGEQSPNPVTVVPAKKKKKELQYDPAEIIQELFETIRNYKSEEGKLLCESFIRVPKRRTNPDYHEVVSNPIDMLKIHQKVKTDEYDEIEQLTADVELMVNNARAYYKKGCQEYIDATDLLDLYYEIRDELLVETFGEMGQPADEDEDDNDEDEEEEEEEEEAAPVTIPVREPMRVELPDVGEEAICETEDFEQLFASIVNATDGDREISEPFHLLPFRSLYPQYYEIIKEPIDLKMVAVKIRDGMYRTLDEIETDLNLMIKNAKTFNDPKSLIYKDACTLKKIIDAKKREIEHRKASLKTSERIRTRGTGIGSVSSNLSHTFADMEYPDGGVDEPSMSPGPMQYEDDSGTETNMSEDENPLWNLFNCVKSYTVGEGVKIIEAYMRLPSKRFYPDYYDEIKNPMSMNNVHKKLMKRHYNELDEIAADINLVFENAKKYNADESQIYKNACLMQKVLWEKKKELEKFGFKEMSIPELGLHFEFPMLKMEKDAFDNESSIKAKGRKSSVAPPPPPPVEMVPKKKTAPNKSYLDDLLRKRLWTLYKNVFEYVDSNGRQLRQIFMFLPSKKDYPDYYKVITDPVDLSMIENKIKGEKYPSEYNLLSDFDLMFKNARHYNEEGSMVYSDAATLEKALKAKWRQINNSAGVPRPKTTKSRSKPTVTTLASKLQDLYESIREYQDTRGRTLCSPFMKVPSKTDYADYYEVIKKPVDMSTIQQKMLLKRYESVEDMVVDFVQMFDNACKYNEPDSLIYKDALTLQRICLEKKMELSDNWTNEVPDIRAALQEMTTSLFIATYNNQDEEGRCYSDSFAELPDRDPDTDPNDEKPLSFDKIKRNVDRGRYRRLDRFQEDMFKVFDRARRLSRTDSQPYEDAIEMQTSFIKTRDDLCRNGEALLTPALSFMERHLVAVLDLEKREKLLREQQDDEKKKGSDVEETPHDTGDGENSIKYMDHLYSVGDFIYVDPRRRNPKRSRVSKYSKPKEPDSEPHIMCIEKIFTDKAGQQQLHGNWFYRPNETFHLTTRKFLEKEVFKSDDHTSISPSQILAKCYVMWVKDYFKYKPEGLPDKDVYVCEFRYTARVKCFKKIKLWSVPSNEEVQLVPREVPMKPLRVASVFADKDDYDDGDTSLIDKVKHDVVLEGQGSEEGHIVYEQLRWSSGIYKVGDCVYVKAEQDKPAIYTIDKIWLESNGETFFSGPLFLRPADVEHNPTRLFYKSEVFLSGLEETRTMASIVGKCAVLHMKDYCSCRPTEMQECDILLCDAKYHQDDKIIRRLNKGLKKHSLSPRVTDDEIYFFRKHIIPHKEPSPLLVKTEDEMMDGEESRDTFTGDGMGETLNTSIDHFTPVHTETKPKKAETVGSTDPPPKKKARGRRLPSGYLVFSAAIRRQISEENKKGEFTFGEISRMVGIKALQMWRNLEKVEKEKYEEKAKKIAEEQQAKQEAAERAFNETLRTQSPWNEQHNTPGTSDTRPGTPSNQGFQQGYMPGYNGQPPGQYPAPPGQYPGTPMPPYYQGMHNGVSGPPYLTPAGAQSSPRMPTAAPGLRQPLPKTPYQPPGIRQPMSPYQGQQQHQQPQQQQMAPPAPPPRPPSPMFVAVPPRTQRLLHSEAYLKYIEGLSNESQTISDWDSNLMATQENTATPEEARLPGHWLAQGAGCHGNVTNALWALRDMLLKDSLNIQRTLPFEALSEVLEYLYQ